MTRRDFLASSAAFATQAQSQRPKPQNKLQNKPRNLLSSIWPADRLASAAASGFHPFPTAQERPAWEELPADARAALISAGQRQLKSAWEVLPATIALEFARNGNRSHYETLRARRRNKLQDLVLAETLEAKGRFTDEIVNGIWLTCEETFWGVPAHLGAQKAKVGLPDVTEPIVELFGAETAGLLAWTLYLLEPQLSQVSKLIPDRIRLETQRRILAPCLDRDDFSFMGFHGGPPNNWDPWICSNWLTAALLLEPDQKRRSAAIVKITHCLDNFLNGYADDGGCDEGPSYWGRAGASLFDCLELLHRASKGSLNAFDQPLIHQIGLYICRAHIAGDWYTNFSDAPARVNTPGGLVYRFGQRVNDQTMMRHGAYAAFAKSEEALPGDSLGRQLPGLFNLAELRKAPRAQALLRDAWMPGIGVMAARREAGSTQGLYLAAEAGNNGKSHNHNDVGNFIVYANGEPAIIDVGVETYTAKTFGPHRYEIWTMQSAFHNCPTIDGVMQSAGRQFAAKAVAYQPGELQMDLAAAYPKEANLKSWQRSIRLDRENNRIEISDGYALTESAKEITLTLMTPCRVTQESGTLSLENKVRIAYDPALTPMVEEIKLEDERLRSVWGEHVYRILLRASNPPKSAKWSLQITQV
jgi:hypothetical protein